MPARKGTRGYYTSKIDNDTITADELDEYAKLLDDEIKQTKARQKELRDAKRAQERAKQDFDKRQREKRKYDLGEAIISKFGHDVDVETLTLGGDANSLSQEQIRQMSLGNSLLETFGDDVEVSELILKGEANGPTPMHRHLMNLGTALLNKFGDDVDVDSLVQSSELDEVRNLARHVLDEMWDTAVNTSENIYQFAEHWFDDDSIAELSKLVGFENPDETELMFGRNPFDDM